MFAKRGIAFKLGLGFALLIIFTVAVASVGYLGLSDLLTRSAKMDAVGDISDAITNARMDMLYFMNSKDIGRKESFVKSLAKARENAQNLKHTLVDPRNRERMDAIVAAASAYEAGLNRYLETEKTRDDTLKTVVEAAAALQSSGETLAKLESEAMAKAVGQGAEAVGRVGNIQHKVEGLVQQFLRSRIEVLYYLWKNDKGRLDLAKSNLDAVIAGGQELQKLATTPDERSLLTDMVTRAETYKNRLDNFVKAAENQAVVVKDMAAAADNAAKVADEAVAAQRDSMQLESRRANMINLSVAAVAVVLGVLFAVLITRAIIQGIAKAITVAEAVSHGDLDVEITHVGADEIGKLLGAMERMIEAERRAADIAAQMAEGDLTVSVTVRSDKDVLLRGMAEMIARLRDVVGEVQSGAENVASGSEEMSASAESLSQGATEQASAVEESSSAMEEMASSISQNADNASQTEAIAVKAAGDARESGQAVAQAVTGNRSQGQLLAS